MNTLLDEGFFVAGVIPNKQSGLCIATWKGVKIWDRQNTYKWLFSDSYELSTSAQELIARQKKGIKMA